MLFSMLDNSADTNLFPAWITKLTLRLAGASRGKKWPSCRTTLETAWDFLCILERLRSCSISIDISIIYIYICIYIYTSLYTYTIGTQLWVKALVRRKIKLLILGVKTVDTSIVQPAACSQWPLGIKHWIKRHTNNPMETPKIGDFSTTILSDCILLGYNSMLTISYLFGPQLSWPSDHQRNHA